jgi:preprotein translocase subunit SecG
VLTRTTALLAAGFFLTSLILSLLAAHSRAPVSLIPGSAPARQAPGAPPPAAPLNSGSGGLLGTLGGGSAPPAGTPAPPGPSAPAPAPSAPAPAPTGPQVPQSR